MKKNIERNRAHQFQTPK
uniref:Uncharacterized protein n=1 Tax=Arundo donax TaxID=35708 RepID=A0A0A9HJ74_ARUDO